MLERDKKHKQHVTCYDLMLVCITDHLPSLLTPFSISANASQSPLLRLPAELRSRIWQDVLTGNTIHVARHKVDSDAVVFRQSNHPFHWSGDPRWGHFEFTHTICQLPFLEDEFYHSIHQESPSRVGRDITIASLHCNHARCSWNLLALHSALDTMIQPVASGHVLPDFSHLLLPLQLLRVCHKICWETHTMPYAANTFHFSSPADFFEWTDRAMSQSQRRALRCIKIDNRLKNPVQPFQGMRDLEPGLFTGLTDLTLILEGQCLLPGLPQNPFRSCRRLKRVRIICGEKLEDRERAVEIERALVRK